MTDLARRLVVMHMVHGTWTWYMYLVHGTWYLHMVHVHGTCTWYMYMADVLGTCTWCMYMVHVYGICMWYICIWYLCMIMFLPRESILLRDNCACGAFSLGQWRLRRFIPFLNRIVGTNFIDVSTSVLVKNYFFISNH